MDGRAGLELHVGHRGQATEARPWPLLPRSWPCGAPSFTSKAFTSRMQLSFCKCHLLLFLAVFVHILFLRKSYVIPHSSSLPCPWSLLPLHQFVVHPFFGLFQPCFQLRLAFCQALHGFDSFIEQLSQATGKEIMHQLAQREGLFKFLSTFAAKSVAKVQTDGKQIIIHLGFVYKTIFGEFAFDW